MNYTCRQIGHTGTSGFCLWCGEEQGPAAWPREAAIRDALTDAIATEDRREWLSPDEVDEIVDDVLGCLAALSRTSDGAA